MMPSLKEECRCWENYPNVMPENTNGYCQHGFMRVSKEEKCNHYCPNCIWGKSPKPCNDTQDAKYIHASVKQCGKLIHTRGWQGAPGPIYCANEKPCKIHEEKCPHFPNFIGHYCTLCKPINSIVAKEEKTQSPFHSGDALRYFTSKPSPTWEEKEREAWNEYRLAHYSDACAEHADYWISRLREAREEAKRECIVDYYRPIEEILKDARSTAIEEMREMLEEKLPMRWFPEGALHLKKKFLEEILSSLQALEVKQ